jgi:hypothetical protein
MEQIRRENLLFESYLSRIEKTNLKEEDIDDKTKKKGRKDKVEKKTMTLTPE